MAEDSRLIHKKPTLVCLSLSNLPLKALILYARVDTKCSNALSLYVKRSVFLYLSYIPFSTAPDCYRSNRSCYHGFSGRRDRDDLPARVLTNLNTAGGGH